MLAGLVNIDTLTTPGSITIQGDNSPNTVIVSSTGATGQYSFNRPAGDTTQFTLNAQSGAPSQITTFPFTIPNITGIPGPGGINVDLAGGGDTFIFDNSAVAGGAANSVVNGNLNIQNDQGGDVNSITNVQVTGSLNVVDDNGGTAFVPAMPARLVGTSAIAAVANGSTTTLTDVMVGGDLVANQGGGNTLMVTSADAGPITGANPVSSLVQGGVYVQPALGAVAAGGSNTLMVSNNTQIVGPTIVTHNGGGSATTITNSRLQGAFPVGAVIPAIALASPVAPVAPAAGVGVGLSVVNDAAFFAGTGGFDSVRVQGTTLIGELTSPAAAAAPFSQNAVLINNGAGGSSVSFGPDPANPTVPGPVLRGGLGITNGADIFGTQDVISVNLTNVFGPTMVNNGAGTSNTTITNSILGSSTLVTAGAVLGFGNPFAMVNDAGDDILVMNATDVPWGVFVNNDDAGLGATPAFSHRTAITGGVNALTGANSSIGNLTSMVGAGGANLAAALGAVNAGASNLPGLVVSGESLLIGGGGGNDVVNIGQNPPAPGTVGDTAVNAPIPFGLQSQVTVLLGAGGNNSFNMQGSFATPAVAQPIRQLNVTGGANSDQITLQNIRVLNSLVIAAGAGIDTVNLLGQTRLPDPTLGGTLNINGGADTINDTINADIGVFEGAFPLGIVQFP